MKHPCLIALVLLLVWVACTPSDKVVEPAETPSAELASVDSLMWQRPDSALMCLIPYFDTCCRDTQFCVHTTTAYNRHYAHLMLAELLYKNDWEQTNRPELSALRNAADRHFNQFTVRISKAYPELTRGDLDYCCLYLLGLTDADIAALMQRAYTIVNERHSKLRKIFGNENTISITLQGIANGYTPI